MDGRCKQTAQRLKGLGSKENRAEIFQIHRGNRERRERRSYSRVKRGIR